ncbi:MAG: ABC transporter ATP-binding protein [Anaerorhabdus sp.]|uniref:ABC transporter ATP-binding protein n=1 Tax=Anaerorhabdus sp. TaxID=1872524 RepID=UPI002FCB8ADA
MNVVNVLNISKYYGNKSVVKNVSFAIKKGECFGILGHNGAGKTTIVEMILGLKKIEKGGSIQLLGNDMHVRRRELFNLVGAQLQDSSYPYKIKVKEACEERAVLYNCEIDIETQLKLFSLFDLKNREVESLSGGERQRLSILLATIHDPAVLFLDELTTGLDAVARREIWKYLNGLKNKGTTIILTSHFMDEVEALCDSVMLLRNGEILIQGKVDEVIQATPYKTMEEAYLWYMGEDKLL